MDLVSGAGGRTTFHEIRADTALGLPEKFSTLRGAGGATPEPLGVDARRLDDGSAR